MTESRDGRPRLIAMLVLIVCVFMLLGAAPSSCTKEEEQQASDAVLGEASDGSEETTALMTSPPPSPTDKDGNPIITREDIDDRIDEAASSDNPFTLYLAVRRAFSEIPDSGHPEDDPYVVGWNFQNVGPDGGGDPAVVDFGNSSAPDDGIFRVTITNGVVQAEQLTLDEAFVSAEELQAYPLPPDSPDIVAAMNHDCPTLGSVVISGWSPIATPVIMVTGKDPGCFPEGAEWWFDPVTGDPLDEDIAAGIKASWGD